MYNFMWNIKKFNDSYFLVCSVYNNILTNTGRFHQAPGECENFFIRNEDEDIY